MSEQSDREQMDKRVADLVAHRTPDELARDLLALQDAEKKNADDQQRKEASRTAPAKDVMTGQRKTDATDPTTKDEAVEPEPHDKAKKHR
jgi:hypothetical protein